MPTVPPSSADIQTMFDRLAPRYDLFNRLTSLGLDTSWRKRALKGLKPGARVLDIGCGTGDLSLMAIRRVLPGGQVTGIDFSEAMLGRARARQLREGLNGSTPLVFLRHSAEELPLAGERFDWAVSGFVLRNIYERIDAILTGVLQSLKSGGTLRLLDFTEPNDAVRRALWRAYLNSAGALFGALLFGRQYPHRYLTESAKRFVKPEEFLRKLSKAGFVNVSAKRFMMGSIVLYEATRP